MIYFTNEIQYYLREIVEIIGEKKVKVYVRFFDGTLVYTCSDFLEFLFLERNISNLKSCKKTHISNICSI